MTTTETTTTRTTFGGPWDDAPAGRERLSAIIDAALEVAPDTVRVTCDLMGPDSVMIPGIGDRVLINVIDRGRDDLQLGSAWPLRVVKTHPALIADDVARLIRLVTEKLPTPEEVR